MLSHTILTRASVGDVASYYGDGADDYYAKDGEAQVWQGRGAAMLGLSGEVDPKRFRELLRGQVDGMSAAARGSTRDDSRARIGIDFTFSAPKSVSVLALVGGHEDLITAHDRAVTKVMEAVEREARARRKVAGVSYEEVTGNLVIAKFRHETTRAQDPELHTHAVMLNLTHRSDGEWRALKNDGIIAMTRFAGVQYRAELARELEARGYKLAYGREGTFEIASFSRAQIQAFSRRSAQIEAQLAAQGLNRETATAGQKQTAAMQTRRRKEAALDRDALHAEWRDRARKLEIELGAKAGKQPPRVEKLRIFKTPGAVAEMIAARDAVRHATAHLAEREAAFTRTRLLEVAFQHGVEGVRPDAILEALRREVEEGHLVAEPDSYFLAGERPAEALPLTGWIEQLKVEGVALEQGQMLLGEAVEEGRLVLAPARYTTAVAIERELEILRIERTGRDAVAPLFNAERAAHRTAKEKLTVGQWKAAVLMLSSRNRVIGIEGFAGTGKSHMLKAAKVQIDAAGYEMRALATYGTQVDALRELGVKSQTVASFLQAQDRKLTPKSLLVIDEAGVVPASQMAQLLQAAERAGARVVLLGDRGQTKAIEAGRPFDQLIQSGMALARMTEIQRQENAKLKEAVGLAATGKAKAALDKLEVVYEIRDDHQRRRLIARDYAALTPAEREQTDILSGTNAGRREINAMIRHELGLTERSTEVAFLVRRDTTAAERRWAKNYEVGDRIQLEKDYPSLPLKRGVPYEVVGHGDWNRLLLSVGDKGETYSFTPSRYAKVSVYETAPGELAPGDLVRITRNDPSLDVATGDRFRVEKVMLGKVHLSDGERKLQLPINQPLHVDHAYASTFHSSQGRTTDRVFLEVESQRMTTSKDTFYVAISRPRHEARVYTDDIGKLPKAIDREKVKTVALDLFHDPSKDKQRATRPAELEIQRRAKDRGWELG